MIEGDHEVGTGVTIGVHALEVGREITGIEKDTIETGTDMITEKETDTLVTGMLTVADPGLLGMRTDIHGQIGIMVMEGIGGHTHRHRHLGQGQGHLIDGHVKGQHMKGQEVGHLQLSPGPLILGQMFTRRTSLHMMLQQHNGIMLINLKTAHTTHLPR